jgi:2-oxoisovalerate dehydrogenase E1 component
VIDLRTIMPLDVDTVVESLSKTHRLLVVDEAWAMCGMGGEIAQTINELPSTNSTDRWGACTPRRPRIRSRRCSSGDAGEHRRIVATARRVLQGEAVPIRRPRATGIDASLPAMTAPVAAAPASSSAASAPAAAEIAVDGTPIKMPFGDLTVSEGKLVRWLKKAGDRVRAKETVVEIETDKAVVEIEAPADGILGPTLRQAGDVVKMGETIGSVK